jgi:hypothetical protein
VSFKRYILIRNLIIIIILSSAGIINITYANDLWDQSDIADPRNTIRADFGFAFAVNKDESPLPDLSYSLTFIHNKDDYFGWGALIGLDYTEYYSIFSFSKKEDISINRGFFYIIPCLEYRLLLSPRIVPRLTAGLGYYRLTDDWMLILNPPGRNKIGAFIGAGYDMYIVRHVGFGLSAGIHTIYPMKHKREHRLYHSANARLALIIRF